MTIIPIKFLLLLPLVWTVWLAGYITEYPRGGLAEAVGTEVPVPAAAFPAEATLYQWRRSKIRAIWERIHRDAPALTENHLDAFLDGDFSTLDSGAILPSTFTLSGTPRLQLAPAGMLLRGSGDRYWPICSAVLTRPDTVMTAGHCIAGMPADSSLKFYVPFEGIRDVEPGRIARPCMEQGENCEDDLALVRLMVPYSLVPLPKRHAGGLETDGLPVRTLGFGVSSEILMDQGLMHEGRGNLQQCSCYREGVKESNTLCIKTAYSDSSTITNSHATFSIDSGAPLFADSGSGFSQLGIARGIEKACGSGGDVESRFVDIRDHRDEPWLSGSFSDQPCTERGSSQYNIIARISLALTGEATLYEHPIRLAPGYSKLIITLNHEVNGFHPEPGGDLDIELPDSLEAACQRYHGVETCTANNPGEGDYTIGVKRKTGTPAYQLAAIAVYRD